MSYYNLKNITSFECTLKNTTFMFMPIMKSSKKVQYFTCPLSSTRWQFNNIRRKIIYWNNLREEKNDWHIILIIIRKFPLLYGFCVVYIIGNFPLQFPLEVVWYSNWYQLSEWCSKKLINSEVLFILWLRINLILVCSSND